MIAPESPTPGADLHAWAERLADALRSDDGDAFIAVYDLLLDDPVRYDHEQMETIKALARQIADPAGEAAASSQRSASTPPARAQSVSDITASSPAGGLRERSNSPTVSPLRNGAGAARARRGAAAVSAAAVGTGGDAPAKAAGCVSGDTIESAARSVARSALATNANLWRDVGVQTDGAVRPLPARDEVMLMLGRRWADACLTDQHESSASGRTANTVVRRRTRRGRQK
jgi:hypothetical protein